MKAILLAGTTAAVLAAASLAPAMAQAMKPVSQVLQWNRTLLVIVRTPGAQPATIHPTRSFAIMHSAIYDAVNAIDGTHKPYLIRLSASHFSSQEAAADLPTDLEGRSLLVAGLLSRVDHLALSHLIE